MPREVIEILSDNEEEQVMKSKEFLILQKQIEDEASMRKSPASLMLAVNMQFIQGETTKQKEIALTDRIKKMFIDKAQFDASKDYFCLKREPNYNLENCLLSLQQIMIYGADFWTTKQIKTDAQKLSIPVEVVKIDDTHKKLKFPDFATAKKWLEFYIKDKSILNAKVQEENDNMILDEVSEDQKKLKGWFELEPYTFQGFSRLRQARFCTNQEKNIEELIQDTKTTSYARFKQLVENELLNGAEKQQAYYQAEERNRQNRKFRHSDSRYYSQSNQNSRVHYDREVINRRGNYRDNRDSNLQNQHDRGEHRDDQRGDQDRSYKNRNRQDFDRSFRDRNRNDDRSRNKRYDSKKRDENLYEREQRENRSMMNQSVAHTVMMDPKFSQNNTLLDQIQNDRDERASNFSFLLDNVHNDISITKALNEMKIEDGNNDDMSIEIAPESNVLNSDQDMSVVLDGENQVLETPKFQPPANEFKKDKKEVQGKKNQSGQSEQNKKSSKFDYLKYLEDCEKNNETVKVVEFRGVK